MAAADEDRRRYKKNKTTKNCDRHENTPQRLLGGFHGPCRLSVRYSFPAYRLPSLRQAARMSFRAFRDEDTFNGGRRGVQAFRCLMHRRETVFQRPESLCIPLLFKKRACIGAYPILQKKFGRDAHRFIGRFAGPMHPSTSSHRCKFQALVTTIWRASNLFVREPFQIEG